METAMEQLSSGKRINAASDDAAGLSIATRMESQVRGLQQSINNAKDGISLVSSVEGALQESTNIMQRMYELSVQASNSTYTATDREALQSEISQLQTELDRISSDTEFNGQKILDGSFSAKTLSIGFTTQGSISLDIADHSSGALSADGTTDATASLMSSVSNIALGADTQSATSSTSQIAVVKANTQAATISQSQFNIGQDATQALSSTTTVDNVSASAVAETFTVKEAGIAAVTITTQGTGGTGTINGTTGIDIAGSGFQIGATITWTDNATAQTYTIGAEDIKETTALTRASVATNIAAKVNDSSYTGAQTATATAANVTFTGTISAVGNTTAATGVEVVTFTGDFDEGDVVTLYGRSATQKENSVSYTVTAADAALGTAALRQAAVATGITAAVNGTTTGHFEGVTGGVTDAVAATNAVTITNTVTNSGDSAWRTQVDTADGRQAFVTAGTQDTEIAYVDAANSATGVDSIVAKTAFSLSGQVQQGDIISVTFAGAAVAHTVDVDDLDNNATTTKSNAIDSFIAAFNAADAGARSDTTGGVVTASREGDGTILFTASVASATDLAPTVAYTNTARVAATITGPTGVAANGAVAATSTSTIANTGLEVGDKFSMTTTGSLGSAIEYTVIADDIGSDGDATLENVRAKMIAAFNAAADTADITSNTSGLVSASAGVADGAIVFSGTDTTNALALVVTVAETNATSTLADGTQVVATEVTRATNNAGSATGTYEEDNAIATASSKMVKFDPDGIGAAADNMEVGDTISITVGDTTVSYVVETGKNTVGFIAAELADLVNDTDGQGTGISTAAAGTIVASASAGELTLTSTETGAASDFSVSVSTSNSAAVAQVSSVEMDAAQVLEVGDEVNLAVTFAATASATEQNAVSVSVTQAMVDLGAAGAREAVRDALIALTGDLENVTLTADANNTDKIVIASDVAGVQFTAAMTETAATAVRQQDTLELSGEVGRGDVFTVQVAAATVTFAVDEATAALRTNDERLTAVRDALVDAIESDATISALLSSVVADGDAGLVLTAVTAGTAIVSTSSTTTNNSSIAAQSQIDNVALSGDAEEGDVFSISLDNGSSISYTVTADDASGATADDRLNAARDGLVAAAASGLTGVTASTSDNAGEVVLTSSQAGVGFETSVSTVNAGDVAQVEAVAFGNVEAGDSFTLTIGAETASYTALEGDDAAAVATWMSENASFTGKALSVSDGQLSVEGGVGESFAITTATTNFSGGVQSDEFALSGTVETNDVYSAVIDGTSVSYSVQDTDTTMDTIVANLVAAINSSSVAATVTASVNDNGNLALTSTQAGLGYSASVEVSDVGRSRNSVASIDISTEAGATAALEVLVGAIEQVGETRSSLGAVQNRLDHAINNLGNVVVNTEAAQSKIEDADFAKVTGELTKAQIMSQAATAMLAQANASKQGVLSLLQG